VVPGCTKDQVGFVRTFGKAGSVQAEERHQLSSQKVRRATQVLILLMHLEMVVIAALCGPRRSPTTAWSENWKLSSATTRILCCLVSTACLPLQVDEHEFFCHPVPLGDNLYCKERPKVVVPARGADATQHKGKVAQELQEKQSQQEQPSSLNPSHSSRVGITTIASFSQPDG